MDKNNGGLLTVWILLLVFINRCHARVNYNIDECQQCSFQNEVPCRIEVMRDSCLSAMTAIHGKVWPGPPRNITGVEKQVKNEMQAQFSWKPPYDSSIQSLKGFLLRITTYEDTRGGFSTGSPWCFFLNLTSSNWTEAVNPYDATFQFNCIKSDHAAQVTLWVSSIPRPHKDWKINPTKVTLRGMVDFYQWKPNISITEAGGSSSHCVNVAVQPPFVNASSHLVCLMLNDESIEEATFEFPNNNVTLCPSPGGNYSIQVKPFDKHHRSLSHFVQYGPFRVEGNGVTTALLSPTVLPVSSGQRKKLQVITWSIVPLILIIVIALTAFAFYKRGKLHLCVLSAKSRVLLPPKNEADKDGKMIISIIYCSENSYVENVVKSLSKIIQDSVGSEVELLSDGRSIEIPKQQLFVITEGIHRLNHMYPNINPGSYTDSKAFVSGYSFLQRFRNGQDGNQQVILLSPIVSFNWLDCCIFKNKNVPRIYQISESENVDLDLEQMTNFLETFCEEGKSENIRSKLNDNPEIITFKNHLLQLYLYMRDNQHWFEDDFLGSCRDDDSHQTQPLLPYSVPHEVPAQDAHYIDTFCLKNQSPNECSGYCHIQPQVQQTQLFVQGADQVKYCPMPSSNVNTQLEKLIQGKDTINDLENFDSGICEQEVRFEMCEKKGDRFDSGVDSIPLDEVPLYVANPQDFIPPESDSDSLDVDAQSLGQHMLDINKYHLHT